jgi:hypothetical protein
VISAQERICRCRKRNTIVHTLTNQCYNSIATYDVTRSCSSCNLTDGLERLINRNENMKAWKSSKVVGHGQGERKEESFDFFLECERTTRSSRRDKNGTAHSCFLPHYFSQPHLFLPPYLTSSLYLPTPSPLPQPTLPPSLPTPHPPSPAPTPRHQAPTSRPQHSTPRQTSARPSSAARYTAPTESP